MTTFDPRVGQRFIVGFQGLTAPDHILEWLAQGRIGGVILFARNVESPTQLAALTRSLHGASSTPILIAIDQEGGMVARMREKQGFTESSGAMALAASQDKLIWTEKISRLLADEMRAVGINWTFAPVVDLSYNAQNPTVGTRSYGRDPQQVGQLAAQATRGFQAGGVVACAKHFPGLGNTNIDSHLDLPTLDTPLETLIADDLEPYRHVVDAGLASIMTTHTVFSNLDADYPATLSPTIIQDLLRDELGFEGVVATDCLEMHAITKHYGEGESSVLGILAGVDAILVSHTRSHQEVAFQAVDEAVANGRISEENLEAGYQRIQTLKAQYAIDATQIDPTQAGTPEHRALAIESAKAGVSLMGTIPNFEGQHVGVVEFASHMDSEVMERNDPTSFSNSLRQQFPESTMVAVHALQPTQAQIEAAHTLAEQSDVLIVVTRNAHMIAAQHHLASDLLTNGKQTILVVLRNPYDADVLPADAVLCTYGDSMPSLEAAAQALAGVYQPSGQRPTVAEVS